MKLNLLSCDAQRPDIRGAIRCINEIAADMDEPQARKFTNILLDGDMIEIEISDKNASSSLRTLRKLSIDYEIVE